MVRLSHVVMQYGANRYALNDISFELHSGEFAYVTGMNGAGKTTLLKVLFAMDRATHGTIQVNDWNVSRLSKSRIPKYRQDVGFIFQDFKLLPDRTLFENVALPLEVRKMSAKDIDYRVRGVLSLVGLEDRAKDYPTSLSGGEQQRIAIARSIIGKPGLLLADEPTGNLDYQTARDILQLFQEIHEMGTTVLIATHDESLIEEFPSRVIELQKGKIVGDKRRDA